HRRSEPRHCTARSVEPDVAKRLRTQTAGSNVMAIVWPSNLQQCPLVSGFSAKDQDNLIRSPTETGPGKTRPRQSNTPVEMNVAIVVSRAQRNDMWAFYRATTAYGSRRFYWRGADASVDDQWHTYQMTSPQLTPFGLDFKASFQVTGWLAPSYFEGLFDGQSGG